MAGSTTSANVSHIKNRESDDLKFYMRVACLVACRSKDPETKVGAVIVRDNAIIATGYNGHVQHPTESGADNDKDFPWDKEGIPTETKVHFVVHAEHNALLNVNDRDVNGSTMYVTLHPCHDCAKLVAEAGIKKVVYYYDKPGDQRSLAARRTFQLSQPNVQIIGYAEALRNLGHETKDEEKFKPDEEQGIPDWDHYFMAVAKLAAKRSHDPNTQVGCCIVNKRDRIVGVGYNSMPHPCEDRLDWMWGNRAGEYETKNGYVLHAVNMAMLKKNSANVEGCKVYVTHYPDSDCVKSIIQSKIGKVIYMDDSRTDDKTEVGRKMLKWACIDPSIGISEQEHQERYQQYVSQFQPEKQITLTMLDDTVEVYDQVEIRPPVAP